MIGRAWLVVSIAWCVVWIAGYVTAGPLTPEARLNMRAWLTVMLALPWLVGWLAHWIVTGRS